MEKSVKDSVAVNQDLQTYLADRKPIKPLKSVFKDSSVWWAITALTSSSMMIFSGANDHLKYLVQSDQNYLRQIQGTIAVSDLSLALLMILIGRYQTYKDLADFQTGINPAPIMARADMTQKGFFSRTFNRAAHNTHDIIAYVSLFLCGVMMLSGISSGRFGEALSGLLFIPVYLARLMPETYGPDPTAKISKYAQTQFTRMIQSPPMQKHCPVAAEKLVNTIITQPPLMLSALLSIWRLVPSLGNAVIAKDPYQITQYSIAVLMLIFLGNSTKDAIGRYGGSIIDQNRKNGLKITKALLEGRLFRSTKSLFKPKVPEPV